MSAAVTIDTAVNAGIELRARWLRANHRLLTGDIDIDMSHAQGRMEGYVQALALLLDLPTPTVRASLHDAYRRGERGVKVAVDGQSEDDR